VKPFNLYGTCFDGFCLVGGGILDVRKEMSTSRSGALEGRMDSSIMGAVGRDAVMRVGVMGVGGGEMGGGPMGVFPFGVSRWESRHL
jgi:hypothetical protein